MNKESVVIGAGGQLGHQLCKQLRSDNKKVFGIFNKDVLDNRLTIVTSYFKSYDISIKSNIDLILKQDTQDIYLTAAMTNVDYCETNKEKSREVNTKAVKYLVDKIKGTDKTLIFLSTDYVFDGQQGLYTENCLPNPINEYGKQKLISEYYIKSNISKYYIVRTNMIFGPDVSQKNYLTALINKLKNNEPVKACIDEWVTPTYGPDLAKTVCQLVDDRPAYGVYHATGSEITNRYKFALDVANHFNLNENLIEPIFSKDLKRPAVRPLNGGLNSDRLKKIDISLRGYSDCFNDFEKTLTVP